MNERWVIDASVGLAWVHPAQAAELALREQAPLGTKDEPLQTAAKKCGAPLLLK